AGPSFGGSPARLTALGNPEHWWHGAGTALFSVSSSVLWTKRQQLPSHLELVQLDLVTSTLRFATVRHSDSIGPQCEVETLIRTTDGGVHWAEAGLSAL